MILYSTILNAPSICHEKHYVQWNFFVCSKIDFFLFKQVIALIVLITCGSLCVVNGSHHKHIIIHVPYHIKHHHHTHTIYKHIKHIEPEIHHHFHDHHDHHDDHKITSVPSHFDLGGKSSFIIYFLFICDIRFHFLSLSTTKKHTRDNNIVKLL